MEIKKIAGIDVNSKNANPSTSIDNTVVDLIYTPDIGGLKNTLIHRACISPLTGTMFVFFRVGVSHVSYPAKLYGRKSMDGGLTWTGMAGTGTESVVVEEADYDLRNNSVCVTPTGRIIIFYMRYYQATTWHVTKYVYSDDEGSTGSSPVEFTDPPTYAAGNSSGPCVMGNRCLERSNGDLFIVFHYSQSAGGLLILLAKSTDNGVTWSTEEVVVLNTIAGPTQYLVVEPMIDDFGDGVWIIVARCGTATSGKYFPVIMVSTDYGAHWAGSSTVTLTGPDIDAGNHNCSWLDLEGSNVSMGDDTNNVILPDILCLELSGTKWIVLPYWKREASGEETVLKVTMINLHDYLTDGVAAIVHNIERIIFNGTNHGAANNNGGNGSSIAIGTDFFHVTYEQKTTLTSGANDVHHLFIHSNFLNKIINDYYSGKLNVELTALYLAADGHYEEADADANTTMPCVALALEEGTGTKNILREGYIRDNTWAWTVGAVAGLIYVDTITGVLTQTAPSGTGDFVQVVGYAVTADIMYFKPNLAMVEVA
jgi:hypothetical protein